jgi:dienelactone hydrolase
MLLSHRTIALLFLCVTYIITPANAGTTQVALFTGFNPGFPAGMDDLNSYLSGQSIPDYQGMVFAYDDQAAALSWIEQLTDRSTLVLIGHSLGGNGTLLLANNYLKPLGIDVDLTVQIDSVEQFFSPGWNDQLPTNVDVGFNYYQIAIGLFEPQGETNVQDATNINAEVLFNDSSITHTSIDNDLRIYDVIQQHIFDNLNIENADFNSSTRVYGNDFLTWQKNHGTLGTATLATGDANNDQNVDDLDYAIWEQQFAQAPAPALATIPEPSAAILLLIALAAYPRRRLFN